MYGPRFLNHEGLKLEQASPRHWPLLHSFVLISRHRVRVIVMLLCLITGIEQNTDSFRERTRLGMYICAERARQLSIFKKVLQLQSCQSKVSMIQACTWPASQSQHCNQRSQAADLLFTEGAIREDMLPICCRSWSTASCHYLLQS